LLAKLRAKEVGEEIARWIQHWLAERTQRVRMGGLLPEDVGSGSMRNSNWSLPSQCKKMAQTNAQSGQQT
jgi:hypothetical protein